MALARRHLKVRLFVCWKQLLHPNLQGTGNCKQAHHLGNCVECLLQLRKIGGQHQKLKVPR